MTCYLRHLKDILDEAGIELASSNRKQIDRAFHQIMGVEYQNCPATWKKLKQQLAGDEQKRQELATKLRDAIR